MEASDGTDTLPMEGQGLVSPSVSSRAVRRAIQRTQRYLLSRQEPTGCWCAELEGDTILESETILLWAFLGQEGSQRARRAAQYLLAKQLPGGGWAMYPGGTPDISGSVKAYFALKLTGHNPQAPYMRRARKAIRALGGADAVNSFTRFYLALLGQISYEQCPAVPPEAVLLPAWFPVNLYAISAWSRTMLVPLSIVSSLRPVRRLPPERGMAELFLSDPAGWPLPRCPGLPAAEGWFTWERFFRGADRFLKFCQRWRLLPLRRMALATARRWLLARFERSDGVGAIYPPIVWSIVVLRALGYGDDSPEMRCAVEKLDALILDDPQVGTLHLQPCKSAVWDTALVMRALAISGIAEDNPTMRAAADWLLDQQILRPGDWARRVQAEPGGWCFEYRNDFYPDNDDTAVAVMALLDQFEPPEENPTAPPDEHLLQQLVRAVEAVRRGTNWLLAMQNDDGGWGAFDRNNDRRFLCYVPFADHNAMIDPSTPDLSGRVLEALGRAGRRVGDAVVDRVVDYLRSCQEPDGCWYGRWGVNYIYGTWQTLVGLAAVGVPPSDPVIATGARWLLEHQQACGGWGESPDSYANPSLGGRGTTTASQTAWAVLGLIAAGLERHPAVTRGVAWLLQRQRADGTWDEPEFTGTGFPRVFYLRYHFYPIHFPLLALARWANLQSPHSLFS